MSSGNLSANRRWIVWFNRKWLTHQDGNALVGSGFHAPAVTLSSHL